MSRALNGKRTSGDLAIFGLALAAMKATGKAHRRELRSGARVLRQEFEKALTIHRCGREGGARGEFVTVAVDRLTQMIESDLARGLAFLSAAGAMAGDLGDMIARVEGRLNAEERKKVLAVNERARAVKSGG